MLLLVHGCGVGCRRCGAPPLAAAGRPPERAVSSRPLLDTPVVLCCRLSPAALLCQLAAGHLPDPQRQPDQHRPAAPAAQLLHLLLQPPPAHQLRLRGAACCEGEDAGFRAGMTGCFEGQEWRAALRGRMPGLGEEWLGLEPPLYRAGCSDGRRCHRPAWAMASCRESCRDAAVHQRNQLRVSSRLPATGAGPRACVRDAPVCSPASAPLFLLPIARHRCCSTCLRTRSTARTSAACWRTSATPTGCVGCGCGCGLCAGGGALMLLCGGGDEADAVAAAACCLLLLSLLLLPNSRFLCMRANN